MNNEIKLRQKKFLIQSRSFAEMLEESIRKYQNRAIEAAAVIEELIAWAKDMTGRARPPGAPPLCADSDGPAVRPYQLLVNISIVLSGVIALTRVS